MLIVMYKPNSDTSVPDAKAKEQAQKFFDELPESGNHYVCISQMLMVDAIRAVMVERNISPDTVVFEVYNDEHELAEMVNVNQKYMLSSWKSFRNDAIDFIRTVVMRNKRGQE